MLPEEALEELAGTYANSETSAIVARSGSGLSVQATEDGETFELWARPIGERTFEVAGGPFEGVRLDFPLDGFTRFGYRLAARVA